MPKTLKMCVGCESFAIMARNTRRCPECALARRKAKNRAHANRHYWENPELCKGRVKQYREENKERVAARQKKWQEENKEHMAAYRRGYNEANKDRRKVLNKKWHEENPEQAMLRYARIRARGRGRPCAIAEADIAILKVCPVLGIRMYRDGPHDHVPSLDEVIPGLGYVPGNIAVISQRANRWKSDMTIDDVRKLLAYMESYLVAKKRAA